MKSGFVFLLIIVRTSTLLGQIDNIGSGHALSFDGIDDYVDLGDIYDNVTFPVTVSTWMWVDPAASGGMPVFDSQSNLQVYAGFSLSVSQTTIGIQYGDGTGENDPSFRRGKQQTVPNIAGRWVNVTAIIRAATDMDIYLNGVNVGGSYIGSSGLPMGTFSAEVAKIGYRNTNNFPVYFRGKMDELRVFNLSLSQDQVRQMMCKKLNGNEPGLIGYWTFDETSGNTLSDKSPNHFNGQLKNGPTRIYSGAPIGDESIFQYNISWSSVTLTLDSFAVQNVTGNPQGVHLYKVNNTPSQTGGLDVGMIKSPYYGVFIADLNLAKMFDIKFDFACKIFSRADNSEAMWATLNSNLGIQDRIEIVSINDAPDFQINLGVNKIVCDQSSTLLSTNVNNPSGKTFLWSTGETSSLITVTQSGIYSVKVSEGCRIKRDTVQVAFSKTPPQFSLGEDQEVCSFKTELLKPLDDATGFDFTWQDGSKLPTFLVKDFGVYWVLVKSDCGSASDSLMLKAKYITNLFIPNVITPNTTDTLNAFFELDKQIVTPQLFIYNRWGKEVYYSSKYQNNWDGHDLSDGVYFYRIVGDCFGELKGSLSILR